MEVTIKFNLENYNDRRLYNNWSKMNEIVLNLEKLKKMIDEQEFHCCGDENSKRWPEISNETTRIYAQKIKTYFDEMILNKLN